MPINKVDFAGQTLIDLTKDTVTAASLLQGATAHDKAGNPIAGTASGPKPEQEKEITISENGDYPITPDIGKVLSKVLAHVNVPTGGGGGGDPDVFVGEITLAGSDIVTIPYPAPDFIKSVKEVYCYGCVPINNNIYPAIYTRIGDSTKGSGQVVYAPDGSPKATSSILQNLWFNPKDWQIRYGMQLSNMGIKFSSDSGPTIGEPYKFFVIRRPK